LPFELQQINDCRTEPRISGGFGPPEKRLDSTTLSFKETQFPYSAMPQIKLSEN
jgi:hypothetical protein